ncbi:MAG: MATE family efflux transporter [Eubacteriales bacterium]|nr:MATE family efflux transporter [Eubacteriales bacterium]
MEEVKELNNETNGEGISLNSDKLRNTPMGKLLFSMALPAIISMLIEALYNVIDGIYVSQWQPEAFDAFGYGRPLFMIVIAVGIGIGVGSNVFVARQLGFGNKEKANQVAKTAFVLAVAAWLLFFVLAWVLPKPFIKIYNGVSQTTVDRYMEYVPYYMMGCLFSMLSMVGSKILQATGNMRVPMISQTLGCLTNIILDPVFIFKDAKLFFFIPVKGLGMGMSGALIATLIGQFLSCAYVLGAFLFRKQDVDFFPKGLKFTFKNVKAIFNIGLPNFILNAVGSFTTIILNYILNNYDYGVTIYTAYFTCQSFVFMPIFGLTQGTMPILGYSYGANLKKRFDGCFKRSLITALCVLGAGLLAFQLFPEQIVRIFNIENQHAVELAAKSFRIISLCFIPAAFSILLITLLQSLNVGVYSMLISLLRQIGFLIPLAFLFQAIFTASPGIDMTNRFYLIFLCFPVAEILTLLIFTPIAIKKYRTIFAKRARQAEEHVTEIA